MKNNPTKRIFSLLLCLAMVLGCLPLTILAVAGDPCAEDGCLGTYDNRGICSTGNHYEAPVLVDGYYQISNAGQLKWFVDQVNSSYTETINAVLLADIVLPEGSFTSIGLSATVPFDGIFDGRDHTIDFSYVTSMVSDIYGLFGYVTGTVKNVKVSGYSFGMGDNRHMLGAIAGYNEGLIQNCVNLGSSGSLYYAVNYIGGIVGTNKAAGTIENCASYAVVYGKEYIGGIAGVNYGVIQNSTNHGAINTYTSMGGGITGLNEGTVRNCVNNGELPYVDLDATRIGGIAGKNNSILSHCVNNGVVNGGQGYVGGIVGDNQKNVEYCTNNGTAKGNGNTGYCGGIAGYNYTDCTVTGCVNAGQVHGHSDEYNGGIVGRNLGTVTNCGNVGVVSALKGGGIAGHNDGAISHCYNGAQFDTTKYLYDLIYWNKGSISDSYFTGKGAYYFSVVELPTEPVKVSANQLASGEVTWLLNEKTTDGTQAWYQNLDNGMTVDAYPIPDATHGTVYKKCNGETFAYSNDTVGMAHNFTGECDTVCDVCGYVREVSVAHIEKTPASCLQKATCATCGSAYGELAGNHEVNNETGICNLCNHQFAIRYFPGNSGTPLFTDDANEAINACIARDKSGTVELLKDATFSSFSGQIQGSTATIIFNGHTLNFTGKTVSNYGYSLTLDASKGGTFNYLNYKPFAWQGSAGFKVIGDLVYAENGEPAVFSYSGVISSSNKPTLDMSGYTGSGFMVKGKPITVTLPENYEMRDVSTGEVLTSLSGGNTVIVAPKHTCDPRCADNGDGTHAMRCTICKKVVGDSVSHSGGIANCASGKLCESCGAEYGDKDPLVHNESVETTNGICPNGCTVAIASVGQTSYTKLADAIAAAKEASGTVVLLSNLDVTDHVTIASNVILDLNGHSLKTTGYFTVYGDVVDGTIGGRGIVSAKKLHIMGARSFLPIYDTASSGYRFYAYELKNLPAREEGENSVKFGIRLELRNEDGYAVLANTTDSRLVLTATITWGEEKLPLTHVFRAATLTSFAQGVEDKLAANETITTAIVLTITGLDVLAEGEDLYLQPTLTSDTTVSGIGAKVAYIR